MNWKKEKLGNITEIISGSTPDTTKKEFWDGEINWVTPKDLSGLKTAFINETPRKITEVGLQNCSARMLPVGSVLFSSRAPIGHVAINTVAMCSNQGFKNFVPKEDKLFNKYLYYWLKANKSMLENLGNGATFKEVSKAIISSVEIPLPSLVEQKRIAAVLDKADEVRRKRQQAIKKLDELLQSVFLDMFGDPVSNPKGWEVKPLKEITNLITDGVHAKPDYKDSGIPFISVKDITTKKLYFDNCKFISPEDYEKFSKRCKAEFGDILYTKVGATYGRAAIVDSKKEFSLYVSVALIKPKKEIIDPFFLRAVMNSEGVKRQADRSIKGIGVPDLHLIEIKQFLVPVPSKNIQIDFVNKVSKIEKQIEKQQYQLDEITNLFNSLQQRAFAGELFGEDDLVKETKAESLF